MSVCSRFKIEIDGFTHCLLTFLTHAAQIHVYGFMHSLRTFRVHAAHGAIVMEDSEDRRLENMSREIEDC